MNINRLPHNASIQETLDSLFSPNNWRSMFIGKAGAGKTYVLKNADKRYRIELLGPSNLAAMVLGGRTLCSWLGIRDTSKETIDSLDKDRIIKSLISMSMIPGGQYLGVYIDEMSFFNTELFKFIDEVFELANALLISRNMRKVHLIWGGDFLQLETIEGNPIYTSELIEKYNITITPSVHRQKDLNWKECLSAIREGRLDDVRQYFRDPEVQKKQLSTTLLDPTTLGPYGLHIVGTRRDVYEQSAYACLRLSQKNNAPWYSFHNGYMDGKKRYVHVTNGIRVKAGKNEGKGIVKGLFGTVIECNESLIVVLYDNGIEQTYKYKEGQGTISLEPGNVVTVHSVQGLTIPEGSIAMVDLMSTFTAMTKGGFYVAASRTKRAEDTIFICRYWNEMRDRILTDKDVISKGLY